MRVAEFYAGKVSHFIAKVHLILDCLRFWCNRLHREGGYWLSDLCCACTRNIPSFQTSFISAGFC